ncbi:MAG: 2-amino-4-hydroxy-6-hydroxymethyldihydropteridine diphosphokinase [Chloroflexi bacterium]|nr:2-amino-4-hydroxy-6-hydroxymethyldihydropteridine diphosphokinase [Chloroflexota bacterium]
MTAATTVVYLGLGSNLGDRRRNLAGALARLAPDLRIEAVSPLYETEPVGPQGGPLFYNAACRGVTGLSAQELLDRTQAVERQLGRRGRERWGPRPIDIDLLLYGDLVIDEASLRVPHPEMLQRAFVLVPLREVAGDVRYPGQGETIAALAEKLGDEGVRLVAEAGWERASG